MREEENKKREAELQSIENFYRDKFEILASDMKIQKERNKAAEREHLRKISSAKSGLTKKLENEIKEMQTCIIKGMISKRLERDIVLDIVLGIVWGSMGTVRAEINH